MDVIARAIGELQSRGYTPDGVVMNPNDYTGLRLLKNTFGGYLFLGTCGVGPDDEDLREVPTPLTWQVPTLLSPSMPQGQFLVGAFKQSTILFVRETANVQIAFQNEDDFVHNLVLSARRIEIRFNNSAATGLIEGTLPATSAMQAKQPPRETAHATK